VEEVICSNSVVEVQNGLEEEESDTYKASCVVLEENGKLGGEHEEGRRELVVVESGKLGEGASYVVVVESGRLDEGRCALVGVVVMGICMASCVVAVESGKLGMGLVVVGSDRLGMGLGEGRYDLVVVMVSRLVVVMVSRLVVVERNKSIVLLKFQMGN
jgi:hypothetical protein